MVRKQEINHLPAIPFIPLVILYIECDVLKLPKITKKSSSGK